MIEKILQMLRVSEWYGQTENIEVAKGKYKIPKSVKEVFEQHRRQVKFKNKNNG